MPSSLGARRESPASGPNTDVLAGAGGSGKRPLFGRLLGLFQSKPSVQTVADPNANALFAFPSEAALRGAPRPIADIASRPAPGPRSSASLGPKLVRPMLIVLALFVVAGLTILAIRRFPLPQFKASEPRLGSLTIDTRSREAVRGARAIRLTAREYALLEFFARRPGEVIGRTEIAEHVWDEQYDPFSNVIDVYVQRLRRKLDGPGETPLIATRRGEGYVFG